MKQPINKLDELFMMECIALAEKGGGYVSPNPMVGAVLVKRGKVIGRGYHKRFGDSHAEVNAIRSAKQSVRGATLYVNLEPCNYFGKTPPCTDLIIESGISEVIIGSKDPNPIVRGKGIQQLRKAGIKVEVGVLENECKKLNESFEKYTTKGLPFVTLKIAQTLDGKIAYKTGNSKWITNPTSRKLVHHFRSRYDAVLVGARTVIKDNPKLTVRDAEGRNPLRIVIDGDFRVDPKSNIFTPSEVKTILFTTPKVVRTNSKKKNILTKSGIEIIELEPKRNGFISLSEVLQMLAARGIASVLVEGGAQIFSSFIQEQLVDKLLVFIAPKIFGKGLNSFEYIQDQSIKKYIQLRDVSIMNLDNDLLIEAYVKK